ncbi:hypothetical protein K461DRAFT_322792 [Myriangium duriaei CBS 260.36]|uniref:SprT-like domain-containing protein n=1 Tax=Myriangium duriaei CBS 260.36 TaxID=1168546 RepID=A0A9P4MEM9_9PEZI|nr:hypothetical protein K461DRAFT_322792 [Myriangium duriaei CBS 260.36]
MGSSMGTGSGSRSHSRSQSHHRGRSRTPKLYKLPQLSTVRPIPHISAATPRPFAERKNALANEFLIELDTRVCKGELTKAAAAKDGIKITWSTRMKRVAGKATWNRSNKSPWIKLSTRLLTDETRLRTVLTHEFCHLTTQGLSHEFKNPHGKTFMEWGEKCEKAFGIKVTTYHNYNVDFK